MKLVKGLSDEKLLSRIKRFLRITHVGERALAFYLLDFDQRALYKKHGCSSTVHFAYIKLKIQSKKIRELLRTARSLEELTLIDDAFAKGRLSWSAVREITRVAAKETEKDWIEFATGSNLRKIEQAVSRAAYGERPPKNPYSISKARLKVIADFEMDDYAVWREAVDRIATNFGKELDAGTALLHMSKMFLERPLNEQEKEVRKPFQVIYHRCTSCDHAWIQTDEGPCGIHHSKVDAREQDAESIVLEDSAPHSTLVSTPKTPLVRMVDRDEPNTPKIRRKVLGRDGHCCATPGCTNKRKLMAHHVTWKSHGGATEVENEVTLCQSCHSAVHEGLLHISGDAPYGLRWTGPDGKKLLVGTDNEPDAKGLSYTKDKLQNVPRGASIKTNGYDDNILYSTDQVPSQVDSAWWRKYGHNFIFKGNSVLLKHSL